jgi:hypothetical protein
MTRVRTLVLATTIVLAAAVPLSAHHAWPVDRDRQVTVTGTVTAYNWVNPHVMIKLDVRTADGAIEKWDVGGPSPTRMTGNGWDRNTLKPGDVITGTGYRFRDGSNVLQLDRIVMADGREMLLYGRR